MTIDSANKCRTSVKMRQRRNTQAGFGISTKGYVYFYEEIFGISTK